MTFTDHSRRGIVLATLLVAVAAGRDSRASEGESGEGTRTPIKHLIVIFQENVSFDHYFATYPRALNLAGEPRFDARPDTPAVNGLNKSLLAPNNPNSVQPFRLDRSQFETADQDHNYTDEQRSYDSGLMDQFVELFSFEGDEGVTDKLFLDPATGQKSEAP
jgi:phospholipase C